jgi:hypothetical protein
LAQGVARSEFPLPHSTLKNSWPIRENELEAPSIFLFLKVHGLTDNQAAPNPARITVTTVFDLRRKIHPLDCHNYLDANLFDQYEHTVANQLLALHNSGLVSFVIAKSVKDEVDNNRTPPEAKAKADGMLFTLPVRPAPEEERKRVQVEAILKGNSPSDKHLADATHVLEAGIHHGYFITNELRILKKREQLKAACGVKVVSPVEWLALYESPRT